MYSAERKALGVAAEHVINLTSKNVRVERRDHVTRCHLSSKQKRRVYSNAGSCCDVWFEDALPVSDCTTPSASLDASSFSP